MIRATHQMNLSRSQKLSFFLCLRKINVTNLSIILVTYFILLVPDYDIFFYHLLKQHKLYLDLYKYFLMIMNPTNLSFDHFCTVSLEFC